MTEAGGGTNLKCNNDKPVVLGCNRNVTSSGDCLSFIVCVIGCVNSCVGSCGARVGICCAGVCILICCGSGVTVSFFGGLLSFGTT